MALERYFPFRSVSGDRKYSAEDWASYFKQFIGNGVFYRDARSLKVEENEEMKVKVSTGAGFVEGRMYILETEKVLTVDTADGVLDRVDRILLRCDYVNRMVSVEVKKGDYGASPTAPELTRDADVYELALADVYVAAGTVTITDANITDQRLNAELCGIVTGLIEQADTTEIFNQFRAYLEEFKETSQADFEYWFENVKEVLSEDATGNLLVEIERKASKDEVAVERARIDNLAKLPEGSTAGDAELADIRVGVKGGTYENAGAAVREQVNTLHSLLELPVTLEKMEFSQKNIYGEGEILYNSYCRGYDTSTFEVVINGCLEYEVWCANIQSLSEYESIKIPLEDSYKEEYDIGPVVLLGETGGRKYTVDGIKTMPQAAYDGVNKTITLSVASLLWFMNNNGYKKIYVTKKPGRDFAYVPKKFDVVKYIEDGAIPQNKTKLTEKIVAYSQVRVIEGGAITIFADNALYGNTADKYAAVLFDVTGITGYEIVDTAIIIYGDGVADEGGSVTITYCKEDVETPTMSKTIAVYKYAADYGAGKTKNIICIGDSYTYGAEALDFMMQYFEDDGTMDINLFGTSPGRAEGEVYNSIFHTNVKVEDEAGNESTVPFVRYWEDNRTNPESNKIESYRAYPQNEGRGGWNPYAYTTQQEFNGSENAFLNENGEFDFAYYMDKNGYSDIHIVLLCMGMNSITVAVNGEYPTLEQDEEAWRKIINSIHAYDPNIVIGIWLTNPPSQVNGGYMVKEKDRRLEVVERLNNAYSGAYSENIYLIPTGISVNTIDGFPNSEYYKNKEYNGGGQYVDDKNWKKKKHCINELHPNGYGYMQLGYVMYAWVKSLAYK